MENIINISVPNKTVLKIPRPNIPNMPNMPNTSNMSNMLPNMPNMFDILPNMPNMLNVANTTTDPKTLVNLNKFMFNGKRICVIIDEDYNPWFYGSQLAALMGYKRPNHVLLIHVKDKYKKAYKELKHKNNKHKIFFDGRAYKKTTIFIDELGLYQLISRSRLPCVDKFREWLFEDLLPEIKKYKEYQFNRNFVSLLEINYCLCSRLNKEIYSNQALQEVLKQIQSKPKD